MDLKNERENKKGCKKCLLMKIFPHYIFIIYIYILCYTKSTCNLHQSLITKRFTVFNLYKNPGELLLYVRPLLLLNGTPGSFLEEPPASRRTDFQIFFVQTFFHCPPSITLP